MKRVKRNRHSRHGFSDRNDFTVYSVAQVGSTFLGLSSYETSSVQHGNFCDFMFDSLLFSMFG